MTKRGLYRLLLRLSLKADENMPLFHRRQFHCYSDTINRVLMLFCRMHGCPIALTKDAQDGVLRVCTCHATCAVAVFMELNSAQRLGSRSDSALVVM